MILQSMRFFVTQTLCMLLPVLGVGVVCADNDTDDQAAARVSEPTENRGVRQDGKKRPPRHVRDGDHHAAFNEADTNQDGFLSPEEFAQMKRLAKLEPEKRKRIFSFLDKNKDGKLHHRELHPLAPSRIEKLVKSFHRIDSDKSGGLSVSELAQSSVFANTPPEHIERMFRKIDRNKNKELEIAELKVTVHRPHPKIGFEKYDKDKNGGLSFEEYSAMPFVNRISEDRRKKAFNRIDANNDEQLSPDEIRKARHPHRKRDHSDKPGGSPRGGKPRGGFQRS